MLGNPMAEINRENKDRLFRFIFGREENKAWTLSLYNAINGTNYDDPNEIMVTTIEDALYMSMKNDLSILVRNFMNFYEQQSTYNPNEPLRFLIYAGMIFSMGACIILRSRSPCRTPPAGCSKAHRPASRSSHGALPWPAAWRPPARWGFDRGSFG